jgi:hypothetical protein
MTLDEKWELILDQIDLRITVPASGEIGPNHYLPCMDSHLTSTLFLSLLPTTWPSWRKPLAERAGKANGRSWSAFESVSKPSQNAVFRPPELRSAVLGELARSLVIQQLEKSPDTPSSNGQQYSNCWIWRTNHRNKLVQGDSHISNSPTSFETVISLSPQDHSNPTQISPHSYKWRGVLKKWRLLHFISPIHHKHSFH